MTALELALAFLHPSQLAYGEFCTVASSDPHMIRGRRFDSSPFATSLVVHCLSFVDHPLARDMIAKAVHFLQSEMEGPGLWRYWSSRNPRHFELELDVDDTCCVAHVLRQNGYPVARNEAVLLANRNPAGLFYTYLAPRTGSPSDVLAALGPLADAATLLKLAAAGMLHEIDPVVQANALLYLGEREETRPPLEYLVRLVRCGKEIGSSRYYPDPLAFYYMLSRAYAAGCEGLGAVRNDVVGRVKECGAKGYGTALATALAACTLLNLGEQGAETLRAVGDLLAAQRADGSWPCSAFYTDGMDFYGSDELTTALCLGALVTSTEKRAVSRRRQPLLRQATPFPCKKDLQFMGPLCVTRLHPIVHHHRRERLCFASTDATSVPSSRHQDPRRFDHCRF